MICDQVVPTQYVISRLSEIIGSQLKFDVDCLNPRYFRARDGALSRGPEEGAGRTGPCYWDRQTA